MCQALQELMKDDIEEKINGAKNELLLDNVRSIMKSLNLSADQAMDALQISQSRRAFILSNL